MTNQQSSQPQGSGPAQQPAQQPEQQPEQQPAQQPTQQPTQQPAQRPAPNPNAHVTVIQDPDDPNQVIIRTRKRKRKKHSSSGRKKMSMPLKVVLIVVGVLVAIAAAVGIALAIAVNQGNVNLHKVFEGAQEMPQQAVTQEEGQIVEYKGHTYRYNENIVSVLVIGHDQENDPERPDASLADTNVLFTIDTATNKVRATVVPRNTIVGVDVYDKEGNYVATNEMQLTLAHGVYLPTINDCAANTAKSVSRVFYNLPVAYYVDFGPEVIKNATTAIGGVQVQALDDIPGASYAKGDTVLLEGEEAYRYVQYRYVDDYESALVRQERQVQFMKALASKLAGIGARGLIDVYTSVSGDITTNLGASELAYLVTCFATGDNAQMEIASLKGHTEVGKEADGIEYERYILDEDSVMENTLAAFYTQVE